MKPDCIHQLETIWPWRLHAKDAKKKATSKKIIKNKTTKKEQKQKQARGHRRWSDKAKVVGLDTSIIPLRHLGQVNLGWRRDRDRQRKTKT